MGSVGHMAAAGLVFAVMAAVALFVIGAFISILRSRLTGGMTLVWCVFVLIAPFIGSLLWFLIGKKHASGMTASA